MKGGSEFSLSADESEAIAFFLLHGLVNGTAVGEFFMNENGGSGVKRVCERSSEVLKKFDRDLGDQMEKNGIEMILVAFSWITVLFSQMYRLPELLRLWDFLFIDVDNIERTLGWLIVAHLINLRGRLVGKDFIQMLKEFKGLELDSEAEAIRTSRKIGSTRGL
jgi:hypothetical protein